MNFKLFQLILLSLFVDDHMEEDEEMWQQPSGTSELSELPFLQRGWFYISISCIHSYYGGEGWGVATFDYYVF